MRHTLFLLLALAVGPTATAQRPLNIDEPREGEVRITNPALLRSCDLGLVVGQIGHQFNIPVGFENARDCGLTLRGDAGPDGDILRGMSPRQTFDHLMTFMPAYSWNEMQGVIVVRPKAAWDDPHNVLNLRTQAFEATDERLDDVLHVLLQAVTPSAFVPHQDVPKPERPINRRLTLAFRGGTMLDALNAVARARGDVDWQLGYNIPGQATIVMGTLDTKSGVVMAPVAVPQATQ